MNTADYVDRLLENAIALSADIHTHRRYADFYERVGPQVSGFTGIYSYISEVAKVLTKWEIAQLAAGEEPWEKLDWVEVTEALADEIVNEGIRLCDTLNPTTLVNGKVNK